MQFTQPTPFAEAVYKLGQRSPIGSQMTSAEWKDIPVALRERAFFSSQVENIRFLQRGKDLIGDFLSGSKEETSPGVTALKVGSRAAFVQQLQQFAIAEGMGPLEPADKGTVKDITSEKRLGLIFDIQTQQAKDHGYWKQGMDPDVLDEFPAQRFVREVPVNEPRTDHERHEGEVRLKSDLRFWINLNQDFGVPWGPWGFGCGHGVEDVDRAEAELLGLLRPAEKVQPVEKAFNDHLEAGTQGLDPDLIAKLKSELGNQIEEVNGAVRWTGRASGFPSSPPAPTPTPAPAPVAPPTVPAPTPAPVAPRVNISPVSQSITIPPASPVAAPAKLGLDAIDQVHDDGQLPNLPLRLTPAADARGGELGGTMMARINGRLVPQYVRLSPHGSHAALTMIHEMGHVIDLEAIGARGEFATTAGHSGMKQVLDAIKQSASYQQLQNLSNQPMPVIVRRHFRYLMMPEELWARAYAQFVAEESAHPQLLGELNRVFAQDPHRQWSTADFAPIREEIKKLFRSFGWMQ